MSRNLALTIIFAISILGPALVMAATGYASIGALGRNPSAAPKVFTAMTITLIFIESLTIVAFLVIWQLFTAS
ncbi:MAG TPA: ATP synthase F0 subunit C [bacterium]